MTSAFALEKEEAARQAVARLEALPGDTTIVPALIYLCEGLLDTDLPERAAEPVERAYTILSARRSLEPSERALLGVTQGLRAWIMAETDRTSEARHCYHEALALCRAAGNRYIEIGVKANLATLELSVGNHRAAIRLATEARTLAQNLRYEQLDLSLGTALVAYHVIAGDDVTALACANHAFALVHRLGRSSATPRVLQHLAASIARNGDCLRAARLLGHAQAAYELIHYQPDSTERKTYALALASIERALTPDEILACILEGRLMSEDDAMSEALA